MVLESLKKLQNQIIEYWTSMDKKKRIGIISISLILLISFTIFILMLTRTKYSVIYGDLSLKDMGEITSKLDEMDVAWKTGKNDRSIMVPEKMKSKIKIELATYGLPKDGYDYIDAFNDTSWTMTEYDKKERMKLALRSQLSSKISEIDGIASAEVFINEKDTTNFVLQNDDTKTTASIYIEKDGNKPLSLEKVNSIKHLVAGAVTMQAEDVRVIDDEGRLLGEENENDVLATDAFVIKQDIETRINHSIIRFLENIVGFGNVDVMSSVKINMDSQKTTIVEFAPPIEGNEEGLVRSLEEVEEHMIGGEQGGIPGVEENTEDYQMLDDNSNRYDKVSRIINNELNQINKEIRQAPGQVESITVAVILNKDTLADGDMTEEREKEFVDLIYAATGLDTKQVEVKAESFNIKDEDGLLGKDKSFNWLYILLPMIIALAILAGFIFYSRRKAKQDSEALEKLLTEKSMIEDEVEDLEFKAEESKMKSQIENFIEKEPESVAQLLRNWLNE